MPKGTSAPGKVSMLPTLVPPPPVPTNVSTRPLGDSAPVGGIVDGGGVGLGAVDDVLVLADEPPHPPRPTTASVARSGGNSERRSPLLLGIPTRTARHATRVARRNPGAHRVERGCACAPARPGRYSVSARWRRNVPVDRLTSRPWSSRVVAS